MAENATPSIKPKAESKKGKGRKPDLRGKITKKDGDKFKYVGKVALWKNEREGDNQPLYTGVVTIDGNSANVSIWEQKPKNDGENN